VSRTSFASLKPEPGAAARGWVTVPGIDPPWEIPAVVIRGTEPGPTLVVFGGVHAAEYCSIEAAIRLGRRTDPNGLAGTLIVVPLVNMPGFYERSLYINPRDGRNINRCFPGKADGTPAERVTNFLVTELIEGADVFLDLHGGDMVESLIPFSIYRETGDPAIDARSRALAEAYDLDYMLATPADAVPGASYAAAAALKIPAIIAEVGQQGIYEQESVARHLRGLGNVLVQLKMRPGTDERRLTPQLLKRFVWIYTKRSATYHPRVRVGEQVQEGQLVAELRDVFGETVEALHAPATGAVLFLVTSLAVREGDPLLAIGAL
jgi:predicted deacylase